MRIAVVGGGLFGCTAAIYAARAGHEVHLYEAKPGLMLGATAGTFARLHRGAHYPRDAATGRESRRAEALFRAEYGAAIIDGGHQFYVVPDEGSHVSGEEFRQFLDDEGISFSEEDYVFRVQEPRVSLAGLGALVRQRVHDAGVRVHLNTRATPDLRRNFDRIVVAAYSGMNEVLWQLDCPLEEYKFQVVERFVVLLPESFQGVSVVVVDGPFGCIDPLDETPLHIMGHVVYANHVENTGYRPVIPRHLLSLIDRGIIRNPPVSRYKEAVEDLARYIPEVEKAVYVGSSFVVRAVLAHQEKTDARPTLVRHLDEQVSTIFSGKLGTCVAAARAICDSLRVEQREAA